MFLLQLSSGLVFFLICFKMCLHLILLQNCQLEWKEKALYEMIGGLTRPKTKTSFFSHFPYRCEHRHYLYYWEVNDQKSFRLKTKTEKHVFRFLSDL